VANVPRANNLTQVGAHAGPASPTILTADMTTAISVGLLSEFGKIQVQCSTGNCTFPSDLTSGASYQTLALESSCVDISAKIRTSQRNLRLVHSRTRQLLDINWRLGNGSNNESGGGLVFPEIVAQQYKRDLAVQPRGSNTHYKLGLYIVARSKKKIKKR
jgi:hypothetical protein